MEQRGGILEVEVTLRHHAEAAKGLKKTLGLPGKLLIDLACTHVRDDTEWLVVRL